ncbi:FAS-associated factor 1-like [Sinocyclocheilus anshuiensis]|uniref:FAS-associated factor 1-like n=1 Tax=Sinocyclocheilus anshuiensis TaxID=1608454 RepID=UPI0007BA5695|nr:PREDICTED: FAS-associated factor 1-like [Sinocyclocheilus anshuiensis]
MASDSNMDREMILADFQACTGIDNIAEAITLLELNNWDLVAAINGVIPQENGILQSNFSSEASQTGPYGPHSQSEATAPVPSAPPSSASASASSSPPSSSSPAFCPVQPSRHIVERQSRMLSFRVEYRQRSTEVVLEDASTVGDIKSILETELQVPVSKMQLKGWKSGDVSDSTVLQSLHLPKNNSLYVLTPDIAPSASTSQSSAQQGLSSQNYLLVISHREAQRDYSLHFPASKTIQEVKRNISDLTNIPVRHQQWDGWPASASDDSLVMSGKSRENRPLWEGSSSCRKSPMMPENSENEGDALLHFTAEFSRRYGDCHPVFYIGSLEAASQEAFYGKARDRKLLAIYLHNDESVLSNVFCSQMMCADSIVSYLSQNFITWAWDVTKEANKARLLTMCTRHFGSVVAQTIRTYKTDQFPLLLIVMGKRTSNEVLNVIQGNTTVDELMMRLMGAMEIFTAQQQEDIKDEDEREAREMVKREQDEAYRLSLEADRKKREAQEREEAEQVRQERIRKEQEEEREAIRLSLEQALPPEPKEEGGEPISKLRIRTPSGKFLERQFLGSCKLQVLFDFVASKGYPSDEFKLLTTFPRRNITQIDPAWSLVEAKLFPQETLFLEAKE